MRARKKRPEALAGAVRARSRRCGRSQGYRAAAHGSSDLLPVETVVSLFLSARACRAKAEALALVARPTRWRSMLLDAAIRQEELAGELLRLRAEWEAAA